MALVTVDTIIKRVNTILVDPLYARWPRQELLDYYNDAVKAIILERPDANAKSASFSCAAGTKQTLPTDAMRLIDVIRNSDGSVIRFAPRKALDDSYPDWHKPADATVVSSYTYDERDPKTFYLYPAPAAAVSVDLVYSVAPQSKTLTEVDAGATADLDDIYINPLIDFILYRCFSKDSEYSTNSARAAGHLQVFENALGIKRQVDSGMAGARKAGFGHVTGQ